MTGKRRKITASTPLTILLALFALYMQVSTYPAYADFMSRVDGLIYDLRMKWTLSPHPPLEPSIVIVDLDEASLQAEGRWPWPRTKLAQLVEQIFDAGAVLVGLDIVLAEPQDNPVDSLTALAGADPESNTLEWLAARRDALDGDQQLARALGKGEAVLGFLLHTGGNDAYGNLMASPVTLVDNSPRDFGLAPMAGYTANLSAFQENAVGAGFVTVFPDADGVVRRVPLVLPFGESFQPSLALQLARQYLLSDRVEVLSAVSGSKLTITGIKLDGSTVPTTGAGEVLVPYAGKARSFPYVPATAVMRKTADTADLEGAIVIIGTSAIGLADLRPTPISSTFPGVEIHANILQGLLHPEVLVQEPDWAPGASVVALVFIALIFILVFPRVPSQWIPVVGIAVSLGVIGVNVLLWTDAHISLPLFAPLFLAVTSTAIFTLEALRSEFRERKKIRDSFSNYIPEQHVARVLESSRENLLEGERREMTVMFADIRNFTALSEDLESRQLKQLLNDYLTPITKIIFNHAGTIDKYVGDMVMAFWNAPVDNPDHADDAVQTAMELIAETARLAPVFAGYGINDFRIGVGLNTGEMNVGDMGSEYRLAYTVLGDAVNLGSRLEGLTKFYDLPILVSDTTRGACTRSEFRFVDRVIVKGREQPVEIFTPVMENQQTAALQAFDLAVEMYRNQQWTASAAEFEKLCTRFPGFRLGEIYLERATQLARKPPPADWDGVYAHATK
jgi:adenylate cyclase